MRIIKFRAWDKKKKEMVHLQDIHLPWWSNVYSEPMQFTGLNDKNGVEIFEGDIVTKDRKINAEVYYEKGEYRVKMKQPYVKNALEGDGFFGREAVREVWAKIDSRCEVIGNVWEDRKK